jgi:hypothetical protein
MSEAAATERLVSLTRRRVKRLHGRDVHVHDSEPRVASRNLAWVRRFGIATGELDLARVASIRCGSFAAHTYPAATEQVVQLGADLIAWLYLFDDRVGEAVDGTDPEVVRQRFCSYEAAVHGLLPARPNAFHLALSDLTTRALLLGVDTTWLERFARSFRSYFDGCLEELPFRRRGQIPSLCEYRTVRAKSVGAYPVFDLIELATGRLLDADEAKRPDCLIPREHASLLCAWVNDIYSFPKEKHDADPLNLVTVLSKERRLGEGDAIDAAIALFNAELEQFNDLTVRIRQRAVTPALDAYLTGLSDWVYGNGQWTQLCGRYA